LKSIKRLAILIFLFSFSSLLSAQIIGNKNSIFIYGQITNSLNGGPIKNHVMHIYSDSTYNPNFTYNKELMTDTEGYFYDTIYTYANKGALKVVTFDYMSVYYDTTLYFRFNWSEENYLFANFVLPIEPPTVIYQANFYYQRNPSGLNFSEYQFFDITNSTDIVWRQWNFGDGNFSDEQNPIHEYSEPGVYKAKLTVSIQPTPYSIPFITEIVKIINVSIKSYFTLGGHVKAGYFPIDKGEAYLYKIENNDIVMIDTAVFNDELGYYYFYQVIEGQYLVKADLDPESVLFNQFMNTYYSNKPVWTEADTIFLSNDNFECDIHLIEVTAMLPGPGIISGNITYGYDPDNTKGVPAFNVEILLFNSDNEPVICSHSLADGTFSFTDLELGTYNIHAELTGKYTFPLQVTLTQNNPEIDEVNITIGNYSVSGTVNVNGFEDLIWLQDMGDFYPNPANETTALEIHPVESGNFEINLVNSSGQVIDIIQSRITAGENILKLDLSSLPSGLYYARISYKGDEIVKKIIKK
jgi:hypothetical protein